MENETHVLKGYENKWSDSVHRILKISHNKKGMALFRIQDGAQRYFRWELQKINLKTLDTTPPAKEFVSEKGRIYFDKLPLNAPASKGVANANDPVQQ